MTVSFRTSLPQHKVGGLVSLYLMWYNTRNMRGEIMEDCDVRGIPEEDILEALRQAMGIEEKIKELQKAIFVDGGKEIRLPLYYGPENE